MTTGRHDTSRLTIGDRTRAMVAAGPNIIPAAIAGFLLCMLIGGLILLRIHRSRAAPTVAESQDTSVGVARAVAAVYSNTRRYVGRLEPWAHATIGPKTLSAYVAAVMVRPGDDVVHGDVLATLDCRNALAVIPQHPATDGTTPPPRSAGDCTFRAPFDGQVATRTADPGTFVAPGQAILTLVDRSTVRLVVDVPEGDFNDVKPGTAVTIRSLATGGTVTSRISRRAPAADINSHSISVEIDLNDDEKLLPLGTTAEVVAQLSEPVNASEIPASAAKVRGDIATLMVVDGDAVSRLRVKVLGERDGKIYVEPSLAAGSQVVVDSGNQLHDGDHITVRKDEN